VSPGVLDEYAGVYRVDPGLTLGIARDGARLLVNWGGQVTVSLLPRTETEFFFQLLDATVTFVRDTEGTVTHLVLERHGERSEAPREADGAN
jgi:serine-type D-Ala-D-Ala carboxypeptidase/endopeptidase